LRKRKIQKSIKKAAVSQIAFLFLFGEILFETRRSLTRKCG
jgi:hypothetical protein